MKLIDVCKTFTSGGTPSRKKREYFQNGTIPWVKTKELNDCVIFEAEELITPDALKNSSAKMLPKDTVLLAMYGATVGKLGVLGLQAACNQACAAMVPKDGVVDFRFMYYLLMGHREEIIGQATGGAQQNLSGELIKGFTFDFPTFPEQMAIGQILWQMDEKIAKNRQISKSLEHITQAIFESWFIDFDPVKAKMAGDKPSGMDDATAALFPDSMEDSELGLIPKGWTVKPLFDFKLEIESGARPKGGVKGIDHGVPSVGAESINGLGVFDFSKTKYVPEEFFQKMNKGKPQDFDVLLYKDGGKPGEFKPRVGMFGLGFPFARYAINEHVFLLRSRELGPAFMYFWIRMERTLDILRNRGIKAAIPGINQQDVGTIPVLWSNPDLISKFNETCMPYLELILTLASESLELARIRDLLLPRLISGELQIPEEMLSS
jgi:type I restriction enzyme S subunit